MRPLVTSQNVLTWLCVFATKSNKKYFYIAITFLVIILILSGIFTSFTYLWKYISVDLDSSLYALFQVAGYSSAFYSTVVTAYMRHEIVAIFEKLSNIYKTSKTASFEFIAYANCKSELFWSIYFKFILLAIADLLIFPAISIVYCWIQTGNLDVKKFHRPVNVM